MSQLQYAWADNRPEWNGLGAQRAGEELETLFERFKGHLTKDEILAAARATNSPLHKFFEWNENNAAEHYRRKQVAALVGGLRVKRQKKATTTRAFVFVSNPEHKGRKVYIDIQSAMRNPEMKRELVEKALTSLNRWVTAYGAARELRFVSSSVERMRRRIEAELFANAGV
ncbi:MAG TPA: hypothetical protein VH439_17110 [Gemmatimonadales bacterium]|jgi:hypothetical protein